MESNLRRGMYTALAKVRTQQRDIPQSIVNLLLDYGERAPAGASVAAIGFFVLRDRPFRDGLRGIGTTT